MYSKHLQKVLLKYRFLLTYNIQDFLDCLISNLGIKKILYNNLNNTKPDQKIILNDSIYNYKIFSITIGERYNDFTTLFFESDFITDQIQLTLPFFNLFNGNDIDIAYVILLGLKVENPTTLNPIIIKNAFDQNIIELNRSPYLIWRVCGYK